MGYAVVGSSVDKNASVNIVVSNGHAYSILPKKFV